MSRTLGGTLLVALAATGGVSAVRLPATPTRRHAIAGRSFLLASSAPTYDAFLERVDEFASSTADDIGVEYLGCAWVAPRLCIEVGSGASSQDIQDLNLAISEWLDAQEEANAPDLPVGEFDLEVGTPGAPEALTRDFEFEVFKGFDITVTTREAFKGATRFEGALHSRDDKFVVINKTGRLQKIPREIVDEVRLPKAKDGDRL